MFVLLAHLFAVQLYTHTDKQHHHRDFSFFYFSM